MRAERACGMISSMERSHSRLEQDLLTVLAQPESADTADPSLNADVALNSELLSVGSRSAHFRALLAHAFQPRVQVLAAYNERSTRLIGVARAYLKHWWRQATVRAPQYWRRRQDPRVTALIAGRERLRRWTV
jgi:hypothetical protein